MRTTYGGEGPAAADIPKPRPIVIPLSNEQQALASLVRIEGLLMQIADSTMITRAVVHGQQGKRK